TASRNLTADAEAVTEFFGAAALFLEVVDADDPVEVGGDTHYVIRVLNQGTVPVTDVQVKALVPAQMEVTRVKASADHKKDGQAITFDPITLRPQGEARYEVYVKAKLPGSVRFKVELSAKELPSGPILEEESTTIYTDLRSLQSQGIDRARESRRENRR